MSNEEAWIALVGTFLGGSGFKIVEAILGRRKYNDDTATKLRDELRDENTELRAEVDRLEESVDEWRNKYYALLAKAIEQGVTLE